MVLVFERCFCKLRIQIIHLLVELFLLCDVCVLDPLGRCEYKFNIVGACAFAIKPDQNIFQLVYSVWNGISADSLESQLQCICSREPDALTVQER